MASIISTMQRIATGVSRRNITFWIATGMTEWRGRMQSNPRTEPSELVQMPLITCSRHEHEKLMRQIVQT
jgi:hypothetical protein